MTVPDKGYSDMTRLLRMVVAVPCLAFTASCSDYVTNLDPFINVIEDSELDQARAVDFLITGVRQAFAYTVDDMHVNVAGLSDEFIFDLRTPTAVFPQFGEIDNGYPLLTNYQIQTINTNIGRLRLVADDLLRRLEGIQDVPAATRSRAEFVGNFYGGLARFFGATYLGLEPNRGGAPIDNGPFIPSDELYGFAVQKMEAALPHADTYQKKVVHSAIAKAYLYKGDYPAAATHAGQGLTQGDAPYQALYTAQDQNYFDAEAGSQRHQYTAAPRFQAYVNADPAEANRLPLRPVQGGGLTFYVQLKYPGPAAPIDMVSWQENNLVLAELIVRGAASGNALALLNAVRASHGIGPLSGPVTLDTIYEERDKELFLTGARLPDQRRFNRWHLGGDTWRYIPIDQRERDHNPNL
jgi:starch-binding outer membrane protein, SusD/RagB family